MKVLVMLAVVFFASAFGARASAEGSTIGLALPLSGQYAPVGKQLAQAARFAARDFGATIIEADTQGTPEGAAQAVMRLAERVDVIIGPIGRRETLAAASAAQRLGVPLFALGGGRQVEETGPWVFRVRMSAAEQAEAAATNGWRHGLRSFAIVFPETEFGREAALAFARKVEALGGRVAGVGSYATDVTNFTLPLDEVVGRRVRVGKKAKVGKNRADREGYIMAGRKRRVDFDALFVPDSHSRVARLLAFLPTVGIQNGEGGDGRAVTLLGVASWRGKAMELSKGMAAGALILDTFAGEASGGRAEEYSRTFQGAFGRRPTSVEVETYDIAWMLGSTLDREQSSERRIRRMRLRRQLREGTSWTGVSGELKFASSGAPIRKPMELRFDVDGMVIPTE